MLVSVASKLLDGVDDGSPTLHSTLVRSLLRGADCTARVSLRAWIRDVKMINSIKVGQVVGMVHPGWDANAHIAEYRRTYRTLET